MPRGHFLAAGIAYVDPALQSVTLANCGLPPLLLCDHRGVRERIESSALALGIDRDACYDDACRSLAIFGGERLVVTSDGVTEAGNRGGIQFGGDRLEALLAGVAGSGGDAPTLVVAALDDFRDGTPFADDVSVVEMVFEPALPGESAPGRPMSEEVMV